MAKWHKPDAITTDEWHTWWCGFLSLPFTKIPDCIKEMVEDEYWYFLWGRAFSPLLWIGYAYLIKVLFL